MRLRAFWMLVLVVAVAAIAWGMSIGAEPVPARPADLAARVDAAWYARLPMDPEAATAAYLARVPDEVRMRGEGYSDSRLVAFALRVLSAVAITALIVGSGIGTRMRNVASRWFRRPLAVDAAVAVQYFVALFALSLPADVYAAYARPHRAGFSEQPFASWLADYAIHWGVITSFSIVGVLVIYRFVRRAPRLWPLWAVGVYASLSALYLALSPGVIEPLTNDFRPLADGPQRQAILALAQANGITDAAVVVGDASRQSRLLNAHVSGFGSSARISLDDTTLARVGDPVLRAVVGHEIGHFVMNHTILHVMWSSLIMGAGFLLIALAMQRVLRAAGARLGIAGAGDIATLPLFWGLFLVWGFASQPLVHAISRMHERQADLYALNASREPHGLAEFMIHDADIARERPGAIEYALFYSHPSAAERVRTAMRWRAASPR